jgi:hypothetical protein
VRARQRVGPPRSAPRPGARRHPLAGAMDRSGGSARHGDGAGPGWWPAPGARDNGPEGSRNVAGPVIGVIGIQGTSGTNLSGDAATPDTRWKNSRATACHDAPRDRTRSLVGAHRPRHASLNRENEANRRRSTPHRITQSPPRPQRLCQPVPDQSESRPRNWHGQTRIGHQAQVARRLFETFLLVAHERTVCAETASGRTAPRRQAPP